MSLDQALMVLCAMCIIAASVLAWFGKDGWGWMIFLALCLIPDGNNW